MLYVLLLLATETAPCAEEAIKRSLPLEQVVFKDTEITQKIHIHKHTHTYASFQAQFNPTDSSYVYSQMLKSMEKARSASTGRAIVVLFYCRKEEDVFSFNKLFVCCV